MKPDVTSPLYKDELSELKGELGLPVNETVDVITENDGEIFFILFIMVECRNLKCFQDQEQYRPRMHCNESLLVEYSHKFCGAAFHNSMQTISTENWCDLNYIIRPYNDMTLCMEELSGLVECYYPNPNVQDFFLDIHSQYFQNCSEEELLLLDPPHEVVVILTLIPVSLIPVLVFLVVWKSKVRE
uniref:Si:ch73-334d15.2 n=1 Tax=Myripristis murdjan TaxID=586833 RepID=A0A668A9X6_9TELE